MQTYDLHSITSDHSHVQSGIVQCFSAAVSQLTEYKMKITEKIETIDRKPTTRDLTNRSSL